MANNCARYAIATPFEVIVVAPLLLAISAQQVYPLSWASTLPKGKPANIHTNNHYAFGAAHDFGMLWKQQGFLTPSGDKIKNVSFVQNLLDAMLLLTALAVIKVPRHSRLNSLEVIWNQ